MAHKGLGRLHAPDQRDRKFLLRSLLPDAPERTERFWFDNGWWGDQGNSPQCVAFTWLHWIADGPITTRAQDPIIAPGELYHAAQQIDEWPGDDYDGTSVRAGAKILAARGIIKEYRWAFTTSDLILSLLEAGPVAVGFNWYAGMNRPNDKGFLEVKGMLEGGHAFILNGAKLYPVITRTANVISLFGSDWDADTSYVRMKNSWGRSWGNDGRAKISLRGLDTLIKEDGEACLATEIKQAA